MRNIFPMLWPLCLVACVNNTTEKNTVPEKKEKEREEIDQSYSYHNNDGCYWKITGRDTLVAWLAQTENTITGKLSFDNYQKDGSSGPVHGTLQGNTIKLWYEFESEGMKTVMEVWFERKGNALVRGVGPTAVKSDTSYFTDHAAIKFDEKQLLEKVDCTVIPGKYK